ncbi:MAG: FtsX-like permease family protein [Gammaproteobacteria bacterium]
MNFLIAYRLLFSKYNLSFISIISKVSIFGLMLGVGILITVLSVMNGFEKELRDKILSFTSHINIYPDNEFGAEKIKQIIDSYENIKGYSVVHRNEILLSSKNVTNIPVVIHNVNETLESKTSEIPKMLIDGDFDLSTSNNLIIGNVLANNLNVTIGDKLLVSDYKDIYVDKSFKVIGIFDSGIHEYNQRFVVGSDYALKDVSNFSYIKVNLLNPLDAIKVSRDLFNDYSIVSSNWTETHNALFQAIGNEKRVMFIILMLIIAIAAFNIISSLSLLVLNKQKDIAILISLGFSKFTIQSIFFIQGLIIGLIGISLGVMLGIALSLNIHDIVLFLESLFNVSLIAPDIYHIDVVPSIIFLSDIYNIIFISFVMILLSAIYPARKAANIIPSQSLKI